MQMQFVHLVEGNHADEILDDPYRIWLASHVNHQHSPVVAGIVDNGPAGQLSLVVFSS